MKKIKLYDGTKTYMYPNGILATPERVLQDFPAALQFNHYVETDEAGEVMWGFQNLSAMRTVYGIDSSLSVADALATIETIINTPEAIDDTPTSEERIAAALEAQVMMSMPDTTEV